MSRAQGWLVVELSSGALDGWFLSEPHARDALRQHHQIFPHGLWTMLELRESVIEPLLIPHHALWTERLKLHEIVSRNIRTTADVDQARIRMSLELGAEADEIARDSRRTAGRLLASLRDQLPDEAAWHAALEGMGLDQRTAMLLIEAAAGGRICRRVQSSEGR